LADLLESVRWPGATFVDENSLAGALRGGCSTLIVSGGDAYQIARGLSGGCCQEIEAFIRGGGLYVGVCAGAYIPLPSSISPLDAFNLSSTKIENIVAGDFQIPGDSERVSQRYCDRTIIHPVRGEVCLDADDGVVAPLYGGPIFREPSEDAVLFRYCGFTARSQFNIERRRAMGMVVGRPAAVKSRLGDGALLLIGPHLEHPGYPEANRRFLQLLGMDAADQQSRPMPKSRSFPVDMMLRRALADLKVAIHGLENRSFLIGRKLWDAERLLVLHSAIDSRLPYVSGPEAAPLAADLREARDALALPDDDGSVAVEHALETLMSVARRCVNMRFEQLRPCR
jgi:hypothetical protein